MGPVGSVCRIQEESIEERPGPTKEHSVTVSCLVVCRSV